MSQKLICGQTDIKFVDTKSTLEMMDTELTFLRRMNELLLKVSDP